jgi:alginate O-acetyltransferase complex protein AlgI
MVLSGLIFLYVFLPLNLILYYAIRNNTYRNLVLLIFSLVFYAWGQVAWAGLLLATTLVNYFFGLLIGNAKGLAGKRIYLIISVLFNLGLFVFFKYSGFFLEQINVIFLFSPQVQAYGLPIGLSFYIFRALSYLVDVYRGEHKAEKNIADFMMFMSLYHLVIGPIVRYNDNPAEIKHRPFLRPVQKGIYCQRRRRICKAIHGQQSCSTVGRAQLVCIDHVCHTDIFRLFRIFRYGIGVG